MVRVVTDRKIEYSNCCGSSHLDGDYDNAQGSGTGGGSAQGSSKGGRTRKDKPAKDQRVKPERTGQGKEKAKAFFGKVQDSGILDSLSGLFGKGKTGADTTINTNYVPEPEKGMSTETKVFIGVGVGVAVLVLGVVLYKNSQNGK